jgi:preprotein translocase subunit SecG
MSIPVVLWIVIAVALAIVYTYRKIVAGSADELVHLSDVSDMVIARQQTTARTIEQLDRIVMILAIVFLVYGLALGGWQIYMAFGSSAPSGA